MIPSPLLKAILIEEDLEWDGIYSDKIDYPWTFTLKEPKVPPNKKFTELTICLRVYSFGYRKGRFGPIYLLEGDVKGVENVPYIPYMKGMNFDMHAPGEDIPFDTVAWFWSSRKEHHRTKNEWGYFRLTEKGINALEWHHTCHVYSLSGKNTGFVIDGDIIGNRNQSDFWANDDNFYTSFSFDPAQWVTTEGGERRRRLEFLFLKPRSYSSMKQIAGESD